MTRWVLAFWGSALVMAAAVVGPVHAQGQNLPPGPAAQPTGASVEDYFKDHHLTQDLEVTDLQDGFAGVTGHHWSVKVDGTWSYGAVFQKDVTEKAKGKMTSEELFRLATTLANADVLHLVDEGSPDVNQRKVSVTYGPLKGLLLVPGGSALVKGDSTVAGRYGSVVRALETFGK